MSATDTVKAFMTALEANDRKNAANYLSNDFAFIGWTPRPLNKDDFLTVMGGLKAGIPGLVFNLHDLREESNAIVGTMTVHGSIQVVGHQTDAFNLPPLSLPPIPQMDGNVSLPTEQVEYRVDPPRADAFRNEMADLGRNRRRDGALQWGLFQDTADPSRFVETWIEATWAEHLRNHERASVAQQELEQRVRGLTQAGSTISTQHFIAPEPQPMSAAVVRQVEGRIRGSVP